MVDLRETSAASDPSGDAPLPDDIPERSDTSPIPAVPQASGSTAMPTRPRQIVGQYPPRHVIYYQFSTSDIRSIGLAQAAATILAAMGTFALSQYLDFSKDITLAEKAGQAVPPFFHNVADLSFWTWIVFWVFAGLAFIWQRNELRRIKAEHGELTIWQKIKKRASNSSSS